jgi:demethylmenaquinone methyltransferase/2-methoxy-6-polyprenyl-1,4-benzoquinol methylase
MISTEPPATASETLPATPAAPAAPAAPAWDEQNLRNPHAVADKRRRVQKMFAAIAPSYDLNNHLHSLWMDQAWRRKAVKLAGLKPADLVVDVACGTGDLTIQFAERLYPLASPDRGGRVTGIDFTFAMLPIAVRKWHDHRLVERARQDRPNAASDPGAPAFVRFVNGDAQALPLPDDCCDVVSIAFGIRNVADPAVAIREFFRVLRPGGRLIILEFSLPTNPPLRGLYNFSFRKILPRTATLISGDKTGAYKYLPESVNTFIGREQMAGMMRDAGFSGVTQHPMTFGVCVAYRGVKGG